MGISDLKTKMMQENAFLKSLSGKTLGVYFNAYRSKAYDGGGEENLTFNGTYCNVGGGLDTDTGIFTCPTGGTYLFMFHIATHEQEGAALHQEERRGDRLHLRPEPQGQPQELDGRAEHYPGREARGRDRGVRLHRHLAGGLPHEPLHTLGRTPAQTQPGGG